MAIQLPIAEFSAGQSQLWVLSKNRDKNQVRSTLHLHYVGWDISISLPRDREAAAGSV